MDSFANTPEPPYYAVIFTSQRTDVQDEYQETSERMKALAREQSGFLGFESAHGENFSMTVSYWRSLEAIQNWRQQVEHRDAQRKGRSLWYAKYKVRICRVEKDHGFEQSVSAGNHAD